MKNGKRELSERFLKGEREWTEIRKREKVYEEIKVVTGVRGKKIWQLLKQG